jgi:hypothetical protein
MKDINYNIGILMGPIAIPEYVEIPKKKFLKEVFTHDFRH